MERIRPEAIRAHMEFLADDLLEGRGTGSRGQEIAARYVAAQFAAAGLRPGFPDRGFLQQVPLRRSNLVAEESSVVVLRGGRERALVPFQDYGMTPDLVRERTSVEAPVIFLGYGVTVPELHRDDYAGGDAKGKLVAYITGGPPEFPVGERAIDVRVGSRGGTQCSRSRRCRDDRTSERAG